MFGSRLAVRLVLLFALVAVLPGALVYAVSVQFLGKSIESWFDVRVDRALEGRPQSRPQRARLPAEGHDRTRRPRSRSTLGEGGPGSVVDAAQSRRRAGGRLRGGAVLVDRQRARRRRRRRIDGAAGAAAGAGAAPRAAAADVRRRSSRPPTAGLLLRVVVPVNSDDRLEPLKVLQVIEPVPKALAQEVEKVQAGLARLPGDLVHARSR